MATAGHSLGGGLAQQAAYAHPEIKQVYAFDSSPVTGFRSVPQPDRDINRKGIVIDRVYERGEILAYIRTFLRRFLPLSLADPSITEIRFNLSKGDPVKQHSMVDLAVRMDRAAQNC
jgi:pimeloyl-ACP methyl ester carboxylesterase